MLIFVGVVQKLATPITIIHLFTFDVQLFFILVLFFLSFSLLRLPLTLFGVWSHRSMHFKMHRKSDLSSALNVIAKTRKKKKKKKRNNAEKSGFLDERVRERLILFLISFFVFSLTVSLVGEDVTGMKDENGPKDGDRLKAPTPISNSPATRITPRTRKRFIGACAPTSFHLRVSCILPLSSSALSNHPSSQRELIVFQFQVSNNYDYIYFIANTSVVFSYSQLS